MTLVERIASRAAPIGVIGLGAVGLTVAAALADAGFRVIGVDVDRALVARIAEGRVAVRGIEPGLQELVTAVTDSKHLSATTDYGALSEAEVVLVAVDLPVVERVPQYDALDAACAALGRVLRRGALVIVESTVVPGTCGRRVLPLLERNSGLALGNGDFLLGHCPERVMPGLLLANLRNLARVCGGSDDEACDAMLALYGTIVRGALDRSDLTTAEVVKTTENAFRDVNIAFANEVAILCEGIGVDVREVRALVNKSPFRDMHVPGAGVGGHCIPKDPWLIAGAVEGFEASLIVAARARNDAMPRHVATLVESGLREAGRALASARVAILGYAYLPESGDTRNSPSAALQAELTAAGAEVVVHDPWVAEHDGDLYARTEGADAVVLMVAHTEYRSLDLLRLRQGLRTPVLVDGRHMVEAHDAANAALVFRALGRGLVSR